MKKIILTLSLFALQGLFANTEKSTEVLNKFEKEIVKLEKLEIAKAPISNGMQQFEAFLQQASDCTQVQQNVINTYSGDPRFTQEQVNNMALGAFVGCMRATNK